MLGSPVATTIGAKGLFAGHPWDLGVCGSVSSPVAAQTILEADCVVAFGASLNRYTTADWSLVAGKAVVHVDRDARRVGETHPVTAGLVADSIVAADAMRTALLDVERPRRPYASDALRARLTSHSPRTEFIDRGTSETVDPRSAMVLLDELLPSDRIAVTDAGHFMIAPLRYLNVGAGRDFVTASNFGSIGLGVAAATGAAWGDRSRPTVVVTGDGGFMMSVGELSTAVRYNLDLVVVVVNDGGYGAEWHNLVTEGRDPGVSLIDWPDLAGVAEGLGATGMTVRRLEDLENVAEVLAQRDGPLLIDLRVDPRTHMDICLT